MRVIVDALPVRHGGGATYLRSQLRALAATEPEVELHTLVSPWSDLGALPGTTRTVRLSMVGQRYAYELACIAWMRADILYCPMNFAPPLARSPVVLTVHNPNYYAAGHALREAKPSRPRRKVWANRAALQRAAAIVVISKALADDLLASYPEAASRLHIIPSGAPDWPAHTTPALGLPDEYMVCVTSSAPHKRIDRVVAGWVAARKRSTAVPSLVVVGPVTSAQQDRCRAIAAPGAGLEFRGQVSDRAEMRSIYERASAAVSMSVLEAFPLTPAEAGSVGCPLILSNIPAHQEATLGNAEFVAPDDVGALAKVLASRQWQPGSRPWRWPVTWNENARRLRAVFDDVTS